MTLHVVTELLGPLDDASLCVVVRTDEFYATRTFRGPAARVWGEAWGWVRLVEQEPARLLSSSSHYHRLSRLTTAG
jgi:hypothetical protein